MIVRHAAAADDSVATWPWTFLVTELSKKLNNCWSYAYHDAYAGFS
jgi:hypothetical protein